MAPAFQTRRVTPEEYLAAERQAETKSEFFGGEVFAMARTSTAHNQVVSTLNGILYNLLRGKPCQALASDMRVRTSADGAYVYPDLTVVCSQIEHADGTFDTLTNPTVVFEVLSPSTERNDRGIKAEHYWDMPSLKAYVLIAHDKPRVEVMVKTGPDRYETTVYRELESVAHIPGIEVAVPLAELYERVDFSVPAEESV